MVRNISSGRSIGRLRDLRTWLEDGGWNGKGGGRRYHLGSSRRGRQCQRSSRSFGMFRSPTKCQLRVERFRKVKRYLWRIAIITDLSRQFMIRSSRHCRECSKRNPKGLHGAIIFSRSSGCTFTLRVHDIQTVKPPQPLSTCATPPPSH